MSRGFGESREETQGEEIEGGDDVQVRRILFTTDGWMRGRAGLMRCDVNV